MLLKVGIVGVWQASGELVGARVRGHRYGHFLVSDSTASQRQQGSLEKK